MDNTEKLYYENEYAQFTIEDGILNGAFKTTSLDLDLAKKITDSRLEFQNGKNYPIISNIQAMKNV